jgi:hypothetical protein
VAGDPAARFWNPHDQVKGVTGADGRFELYGFLPQEEFELNANHGEQRSAPLVVRAGARDALLLLSPRFALSGRLSCDAAISTSAFALELASGEAQHAPTFVAALSDRDGEGLFRFEHLPNGIYELTCKLDGRTLLSLPGIAVAGHVDVGSLDLRGLAHAFQLVLLGVEQSRCLEGRVSWRASGSQEEWREHAFDEPKARFVSADPMLDLRVEVSGYRAATRERVSAHCELALQPALRARIELVTDGPLPEYPYVLDADLRQDGRQVGAPEGPRHFTAHNRSALFLVAAPGKLRVHWHFERHGDAWAVGGLVLEAHTVEIELLDLPGEQVFRVPLDGEALRQLVSHPPF